MPKRTRSYRDSFLRDLLDPVEAANYLNVAVEDPEEDMLLLALRDIAEAHQLALVAREAGMARESIYRALSASGNPRYSTLSGIVRALGLRFRFEPCLQRRITLAAERDASTAAQTAQNIDIAHSARGMGDFSTLSRLSGTAPTGALAAANNQIRDPRASLHLFANTRGDVPSVRKVNASSVGQMDIYEYAQRQ
jgi:probable addiction module antidote protein